MELTTEFQRIGQGSSVTYGGAKGYLELWAKYNSQDVASNKSNVTVELRLVVTQGYIGNYQATYWSISGDLSNNGNLGSGEYRSRTLGSATGDITHNTDGTKSVSFSGSFNPTAWGYSMSVSGSATLPNLHKPPIIQTAEMIETNSTLTALNVPNTTIVRYLSKKTITLHATPEDNATINGYRLEHFNKNYNIPSSGYQTSNSFSTNYTTNDVSISDGKANIIQKIKDNMNGESTGWVYVSINGTPQKPNGIAYSKPVIERSTTTIKRKSGGGVNLTDNKAVLNLKATFYKVNDVIGNNNNIQQIGYKIWDSESSEPSSYTSITPTISGGNITVTDLTINNVDFTKVYNYKIIVKDRYNYADEITNGTISMGLSLWTEYKDHVDFMELTVQKYNPFEYSTSETICGIWNESGTKKYIYRKVLGNIGTLGNGGSKSFSTSGMSISKVLKIGGVINYDTNYTAPIDRVRTYYNSSNNTVTAYNFDNLNINNGYVYIEYIKTS